MQNLRMALYHAARRALAADRLSLPGVQRCEVHLLRNDQAMQAEPKVWH
jgi:hypothetical protein